MFKVKRLNNKTPLKQGVYCLLRNVYNKKLTQNPLVSIVNL